MDQLRKTESLLSKLQEQQDQLEQTLSDSGLYDAENKDRLKELLNQQTTIKQQLAQAEADWMEAAEALELAENDLG